MTAGLTTSADLAADRRYAWAMAALAEGQPGEAADLLRQTLELVPDWAPAWLALGDACLALGDRAGSTAAWRRSLELEPLDRLGAGPRLARIGAQPVTNAMSQAYVAALFDDYAPRFDRHLTESLGYRGPALIAAALDRVACGRRFFGVLDAGCGTGLAGVVLRPRSGWLGGCDLSTGMLAQARRRNLYDDLVHGDLRMVLSNRPEGALDLVVAADVLIYVPDLRPVFEAAARALATEGLLAFTTQDSPGKDICVGPDLRVGHPRDVVLHCAQEAGFDVVLAEQQWVRLERGEPVPGMVAVLRRR